jgi:nucleoid DNA-binding protein
MPELAVKMILDAMAESLRKGERIEIRGFGSFGLNYRPPRTGAIPSPASRCSCRRSTSRISRRARNCASASTSRANDAHRALDRRAVLFLALLFLSLQNSGVVSSSLQLWTGSATRIVVLISFAVGVAAGLLAGALRASKLRRQVNRLTRAKGTRRRNRSDARRKNEDGRLTA